MNIGQGKNRFSFFSVIFAEIRSCGRNMVGLMPTWNHLVRGLAERKALLVCATETRRKGRICCKMDGLSHGRANEKMEKLSSTWPKDF